MKKKIALLFPPEITDKPLITDLVKHHNIVVNILKASISGGKQGKMTLELSGKDEDVEKAMAYLDQENLEVIIYTDSVIRYEEQCVEGGACVGVCPSKALTMNAPDYLLQFEMELCLLCGHCVKACPVRAITFFDDESY